MDHVEFLRVVGEWNMSCGVKVQATAGAVFVFDFASYPEAVGPDSAAVSDEAFKQGIEAKRIRVELINVFALCLHTAAIELDMPTFGGFRVTHEDLVDSRDLKQGMGGPGLRHMPVSPEVGGYVVPFRHLVCIEDEIARACALVDEVLARGERLREIVALLNHALDACRGHDFGLAVVTAWTVAEVLIQARWKVHTEQAAAAVGFAANADRRKFWEGRDFTAAVVTDMLTLAGELPTDLHQRITKTRQKRNAWAHDIGRIGYAEAVDAVVLARDLLALVHGIDLKVSPRISLSS